VKEIQPTIMGAEIVEETTMSPQSSELNRASNEGKTKMIINVVTSAPRLEVKDQKPTISTTSSQSSTAKTGAIDNDENTIYRARKVPQFNGLRRTFPSSLSTDLPAVSTVSTPIVKTTTTQATTPKSSIQDNLVVDKINRAGQAFLDFDDAPIGGLHVAASSQPARVNVRPAASGNDYEYEYIYYYYDDEDEKNGTATTSATPARRPSLAASTTTTTNAPSSTTTAKATTTTTSAPVFQRQQFEQVGNGFNKNVAPSDLNTVQRGEKFGDNGKKFYGLFC